MYVCIYTHIYIYILCFTTLYHVYFLNIVEYMESKQKLKILQSIDGNYRANALNAGIQRSL